MESTKELCASTKQAIATVDETMSQLETVLRVGNAAIAEALQRGLDHQQWLLAGARHLHDEHDEMQARAAECVVLLGGLKD